MTLDQQPLAVQDTETGEYVRLPVTLLPEYHAREAARFLSMPWADFVKLPPSEFIGGVAHYIAQKLISAHEADAVRLQQESDLRTGGKRGA